MGEIECNVDYGDDTDRDKHFDTSRMAPLWVETICSQEIVQKNKSGSISLISASLFREKTKTEILRFMFHLVNHHTGNV